MLEDSLKKILLMLAIVLFGSGAFAQDFHVGGKLAFDAPQFIGIFGRMDFGDRAEPGFGLRFTAGGFEIPVGFLGGSNENSDFAKMKWEVFDNQIKQKLLRLVNPSDNL